jgi:hypothetical protein
MRNAKDEGLRPHAPYVRTSRRVLLVFFLEFCNNGESVNSTMTTQSKNPYFFIKIALDLEKERKKEVLNKTANFYRAKQETSNFFLQSPFNFSKTENF